VLYLGDASDGYALYKVPLKGGEPEKISDKTLNRNPPVISPDGTRAAVRSYDEGTDKWRTEILQTEGGASIGTLDLGNGFHQWSLTGDALDYVDHKDGAGNIWSQPLDGGAPRQLTYFETEQIDDFAWAPDGKTIALTRRAHTWDVVLLKNFR
jgi:Tol biopolymer transport system component